MDFGASGAMHWAISWKPSHCFVGIQMDWQTADG